jgi:hypothetical protein
MIEAMNARRPDEKSQDVADRVGKEHGKTWRTAYEAWNRQKEIDEVWAELQKRR